MVYNALVDSIKPEMLVLVADHAEGTRLMRSRPHNVNAAFTADGDKISISDNGAISHIPYTTYGQQTGSLFEDVSDTEQYF